jgi:hypothetical protein
MPAAVLLAATVVAVLCPREVVFVDTAGPAVIRRVPLPSAGLGIFAAPDRRVVIPLGGEDATAVVGASGNAERWPGRVFPMFFTEYDRMHVLLPGLMATLSYPERLPLRRIPLEGVPGVRRAACSLDGRLVAAIPSEAGAHTLVLIAALEGGTAQTVALPEDANYVVMAGDGAFVVVAMGGANPALVMLGEGRARGALRVTGEVRCMCLAPNGKDVLVGLATAGSGEVLMLKVDPSSNQPLKERFRTPLPAPVCALAPAGEELAAVSGEALLVLAKGGRHVRGRLAVPGAREVAVLPAEARSTLPAWSDHP